MDPTDHNAIMLPGASQSSCNSLGENSGLKFILLYSPRHLSEQLPKRQLFLKMSYECLKSDLRMAMIYLMAVYI